ncbi:hypothetical protein [Mycobacterium sp. NPDC004974]
MTAPTPNSMPGAQQQQTQQPGQSSSTPPAEGAVAPTPPWGTDNTQYDPDKAARLIANLRTSEDNQSKTIQTQNAKIAELEAQLSQAQPLVDAHTEQQRREQGEVATLRQDMDGLKGQLTTAQQTAQANLAMALQAKAEALASNRDPQRPGSAFINPGTAAKLIDVADCLTEDGTVDDKAIASKLDALAQSDPYLIATATTAGRKPNPAQGQGNGSIPAAAAQQLAEKAGDIKGAVNAVAQHLTQAARGPQY